MAEKASLAEIKAALKENFGPNVLGSGEKLALTDRRVSSGSFELDMALGGSVEGGFGIIIGRVHSFWGDKSGGKTTTAHRVAGVFQGMCRNCWRPAKNVEAVPPTEKELNEDPETRWSAKGECDCYAQGLMDRDFIIPDKEKGEKAKDYAERVNLIKDEFKKNSYEETVVAFIDAEDAFEKRYFANFGDPRRLLLVKPSIGEDASDLSQALASSFSIDLIILDSLAHFMPNEEVEKSAHEWQRGLQARIVNKTIRRMIGSSASSQRTGRRLTQIWINQTRIDINKSFGDPSIKPSGLGQEFAAHVEIRFRTSKVDSIAEKWGTEKEILTTMTSEKFKFEVSKNKTAATKARKGTYEQTPDGKIVEHKTIMKMTEKWLVKENKKGDKYTIGEMGFKTKKAIMEAIQNDPEFCSAIKESLFIRNVPGSE